MPPLFSHDVALCCVQWLMRHGLTSLSSWGLALHSNSLLQASPSFSLSLNNLVSYFSTLRVSMHEIFSLFGFFTFMALGLQLISGTMLAFSLVPEAMLIPMVRDEEDIEDLYTDDFF
jgi:hypothetical protein